MSETLIGDVSDTSFWVAYFRAKESTRRDALFHDPFAQKLVGERGKKISDSMAEISRYTEWSVVARTVIIDRFIENAIQDGVTAIINLGAGLDARPYRMKLPADLRWVEVDYPNIIQHKEKLLRDDVPKCQLTRVGLDLADAQKRRAFLAGVVTDATKVLVLTEGVIPYLSPEQVSDLAQDLHSQSRFQYWITEYFDPRVYRYLKRTIRENKMKNAPFLFYPEDWFGFFRKLNWIEKETRFMGEIAIEFKRKPPMPWWAALLVPLMPAKKKSEMVRMTGYTVLRRS